MLILLGQLPLTSRRHSTGNWSSCVIQIGYRSNRCQNVVPKKTWLPEKSRRHFDTEKKLSLVFVTPSLTRHSERKKCDVIFDWTQTKEERNWVSRVFITPSCKLFIVQNPKGRSVTSFQCQNLLKIFANLQLSCTSPVPAYIWPHHILSGEFVL